MIGAENRALIVGCVCTKPTVVCVSLQERLEKEAEQRLAQLSELAHDEAVL